MIALIQKNSLLAIINPCFPWYCQIQLTQATPRGNPKAPPGNVSLSFFFWSKSYFTSFFFRKEIQGFFGIPVDNLRASPFLIHYICHNIPDYKNAIIVAKTPKVMHKATSYANRLRFFLFLWFLFFSYVFCFSYSWAELENVEGLLKTLSGIWLLLLQYAMDGRIFFLNSVWNRREASRCNRNPLSIQAKVSIQLFFVFFWISC